MFKEDPTCQTDSYRYILALSSSTSALEFVLPRHARKNVHYSLFKRNRLGSQIQIQVDKIIFIRIRKLYNYVQGLVLKFIVIKNHI